MFFVFIFFWIIAIFIYLNKNRTKADCWAARTFFLFGVGGISVIFREQADIGNLSWLFPAVAGSIAMLWGPYALLMFALHFSGKIPKEKRKQIITAILVALPLIIFYFAVPALKMFGHAEPQSDQDVHTFIMTVMIAPYYLGTACMVGWKLFRSSDFANRTENITTFLISVPTTLTYYLFAYILPCFGHLKGWEASLEICLVASALFVIFTVKKNVFGLSFNEQSISRKRMEATAVEGTSVLQSIMKNSLLDAELALQSAQKHYLYNQEDMVLVMKDVQTALVSFEQSISVLEKIRLKINPVGLNPKVCSLLPILEQAIDQSRNEHEDKNVQIVRDFQSDPQIFCDPVHIEEAILNLVNNAIEAVNDDGSGLIVISITQSKHKAKIQIRDNGAGIDKYQAKQLGIPFLTSKDKESHYGLGLYYVKKIINMHDGEFALKKSTAKGILAEIILPSIRKTEIAPGK
ncbi:HAMP domain-containing sensor histidine kinase [Dehalobacter restrictus]|uniref:HAMP domain-containing sensor histidine kinase n=1 Tax=Dehalobacter restrictus TaxID=55583 RepID=UPI00338DA4CB